MVLKFLVPSFVLDIWHTSHFDTIVRLLMVFVLECVLVKIYRILAIVLRCRLIILPGCKLTIASSSCIGPCSFKAASPAYLLSGQKFIDCAPIVRRSQLQFLQVERLGQAGPSRIELAICIHIYIARGAAIVLGRLANLVPLLCTDQRGRVRSSGIHLFCLIDIVSWSSCLISVHAGFD